MYMFQFTGYRYYILIFISSKPASLQVFSSNSLLQFHQNFFLGFSIYGFLISINSSILHFPIIQSNSQQSCSITPIYQLAPSWTNYLSGWDSAHLWCWGWCGCFPPRTFETPSYDVQIQCHHLLENKDEKALRRMDQIVDPDYTFPDICDKHYCAIAEPMSQVGFPYSHGLMIVFFQYEGNTGSTTVLYTVKEDIGKRLWKNQLGWLSWRSVTISMPLRWWDRKMAFCGQRCILACTMSCRSTKLTWRQWTLLSWTKLQTGPRSLPARICRSWTRWRRYWITLVHSKCSTRYSRACRN